MNIDTLIKYCTKGKVYGWTLSWYGLKKYEYLEKKGLIKFEELEFELDESGIAKIIIYKNTGNTLFYYKGMLIHFNEIKLVVFEVLGKLNYCLNISLNETSIATLEIDSKIGIKLEPVFLGKDIALIKHSELLSADIC